MLAKGDACSLRATLAADPCRPPVGNCSAKSNTDVDRHHRQSRSTQ